MSQSPKVIQSVQRALDIIECFDYHKKELSLSEISQELKLNPSTVHGILLTLQVNSYIEKLHEKSRYKLGPKLLEKGTMVLEGFDIRSMVRATLESLTSKYKETSHLCVYEGGSLYVIDKSESPASTFYMTSKIGMRIPLHSSASGKLILAYQEEYQLDNKADLEKIRNQGYALEDEEIEVGLYTIAAPLFNHKGKIMGTIGVLGPAGRIKEKQDQIIEDLLMYSKQISRDIGYKL